MINSEHSLNSPPLECLICGEPNMSALQYVRNSYQIYRCKSCSGSFVFPQPSDRTLQDIYTKAYFQRGNKYTPKVRHPRLDPNRQNDLRKIQLLKRYLPEGELLDVGCGMGGFLQLAREHGYHVKGVEISEDAVREIRQNFELEVMAGDLLSMGFPSKSFDLITLWDVIEHLKNPNLLLAEVYRLLRPGGLLAFSTGDISSTWARITGRYWQLLTPPQHLYFYTPGSLEKLLEQHNFSVEEILYPGKKVTLDFISFKARETFGAIFTPIRAIIAALALQNVQVSVNLKDIMMIVVKKI